MSNVRAFLALVCMSAFAHLAFAGEVEKTIEALEQQWINAERTNNADLSAPLFAETAIFPSLDGKTVRDKAAFVASERATKYKSADITELDVMAYGDTAIASYLFKATGTDSDDKPMDITQRITDTWVKMADGQWQVVASHATLVK